MARCQIFLGIIDMEFEAISKKFPAGWNLILVDLFLLLNR